MSILILEDEKFLGGYKVKKYFVFLAFLVLAIILVCAFSPYTYPNDDVFVYFTGLPPKETNDVLHLHIPHYRDFRADTIYVFETAVDKRKIFDQIEKNYDVNAKEKNQISFFDANQEPYMLVRIQTGWRMHRYACLAQQMRLENSTYDYPFPVYLLSETYDYMEMDFDQSAYMLKQTTFQEIADFYQRIYGDACIVEDNTIIIPFNAGTQKIILQYTDQKIEISYTEK